MIVFFLCSFAMFFLTFADRILVPLMQFILNRVDLCLKAVQHVKDRIGQKVMLRLILATRLPSCLMHLPGTPTTVQFEGTS